MPITIKTPVYEGPLDLLLDLIEKRKLLINDISLASVADEYIKKINTLKELPVGETAEFVSLAATLLLIKSRSLLPMLELSEDESRDIKELEYRLAVYQLVKEAARELSKHVGGAMLFEGNIPEQMPIFVPDPLASQESLLGAAHMLISGFPQQLLLPKVEVKKIISLEEMIERLANRVSSAMRLSFREFAGLNKKNNQHIRGEIIVGFLALLELIKQGIIKASQERDYGDITLESDAISIPLYE